VVAGEKKPSVLLVEDDARSARVLARMLREDGFDVHLALDGSSAIQRLSRLPLPDVLVTDLYLPHVTGVTVAKYARSRVPRIPVLVVTGFPHFAATELAAFEPPAIVLVKPIQYVALQQEIERARPGT
jgi:two-component system response regulator MprA